MAASQKVTESSPDRRSLKLQFVTFLTFVRFPLVLLFFAGALIYANQRQFWFFATAFTCLVVSAITDLFDGYFARKFNVETRFGAHADPLMDKLFYLATMPLLVFIAAKNGHIPHAISLLVLTIFFLARDQWVTFLRSIGSMHNVGGGANWSGKLRTCINYPLICGIYLFEESPIPLINVWLLYSFEVIAFAVNIVSLCIYTRHYWPCLRRTLTIDEGETEVEGGEKDAAIQQKLFQAEKIESMSTMAAGIAHDLNNLLAAILGNIGIILRSTLPESPAKSNAEQVESATLRAIDLANQILVFSGKSRFIIEKFDISALVRDMSNLLEVSVSKGINIEYKTDEGLAFMEGDPSQIRQLITNLVANASDAITDGNGTVTVSTGMIQCDKAYLSETYFNENLPEGRYVYIEVSDTGCGMSREVRAKMFDPFFTDKIRGKGLGLAVVTGVVRAHDGAIKVKDTSEKGCTFTVLFPSESSLKGI